MEREITKTPITVNALQCAPDLPGSEYIVTLYIPDEVKHIHIQGFLQLKCMSASSDGKCSVLVRSQKCVSMCVSLCVEGFVFTFMVV